MIGKNSFLALRENKHKKYQKGWIFFLGLSHKLGKTGEILEAFASSTLSGNLLQDERFARWEALICRCNLVWGVPLDANGKLRYPNQQEIKKGIKQVLKKLQESKPKMLFLFGKQVQNAILKSAEICAVLEKEKCKIICKPHPAYIAVYKKQEKADYLQAIFDQIYDSFNL